MSIQLTRIQKSFFSKHWLWQVGGGSSGSVRVVDELTRLLPHIEPSSWPSRFALGGIYLAGRPISSLDVSISTPCRLEYYEPKIPLTQIAEFYPVFSSDWIIYSDDDLAVVYKPSQLSTTVARDQCIYSLEGYLRKHFEKAVHLPSRLDTAVSGLLICSLSGRMNRYLQKAYERRWIEKYYLAEVSTKPSWAAISIDSSIARDPTHPVLRKCVAKGDGEIALTEVVNLGSSGLSAILQARPITGRTHQIRVHLASVGFPIIGDPFYDGADSTELHLVSYALRFHHPYLERELDFRLPERYCPSWFCSLPKLTLDERSP